MADRGKPIPFALREQIKADKLQGATVRQIAAARGLNRNTVSKWTRSLGQNYLTERENR